MVFRHHLIWKSTRANMFLNRSSCTSYAACSWTDVVCPVAFLSYTKNCYWNIYRSRSGRRFYHHPSPWGVSNTVLSWDHHCFRGIAICTDVVDFPLIIWLADALPLCRTSVFSFNSMREWVQTFDWYCMQACETVDSRGSATVMLHTILKGPDYQMASPSLQRHTAILNTFTNKHTHTRWPAGLSLWRPYFMPGPRVQRRQCPSPV